MEFIREFLEKNSTYFSYFIINLLIEINVENICINNVRLHIHIK